MGERLFHLFDGLVIELVRFKAHALGVVHGGLGLDAEQNLMGVRVVGVEIVAVIGGHQGQVGGFRDLQQGVVDDFLLEAAGVDVRVFPGQAQGLVHVLGQDGAGNLARDAGRKAGQALGVAAQQLLVHAGLVVKTV